MVHVQTLLHGFFLVVIALDQIFASDVVFHVDLGRVEHNVVGTARSQVNATTRHALDDFCIRHVDLDNGVDGYASRLHGISLGNGAREAVKQETVRAIGFLDAVLDQTNDDFIRHQTACVHDLLGSQTHLGACLDSGTQHVAGGDLRNAVAFLDVVSLGTFARAGAAEKNQSHVKTSLNQSLMGMRVEIQKETTEKTIGGQ